MCKILHKDKAWIETLHKLGFGYRSVAKFLEKVGSFARWKQSVNRLMSVGPQWNESQTTVGQKQHKQRKMLDSWGLLNSGNRTLTLMLRHFTKYSVNWIKLNKLVKKYMLNKYEKFCVKIFLHCIDFVIFALGYFILTHPVHVTCELVSLILPFSAGSTLVAGWEYL